MRKPYALIALLVTASSALAATADAQETRAQRADRLFNEANKLADAGDFAAACPKYEESNQLDPAIGTGFNLADCYEHIGRTGTALILFRGVEVIAREAGKEQRQASARQRADALDRKVARMVIVFAPHA